MTEYDRRIDVEELREQSPYNWEIEALHGGMVVGSAPMSSCPEGLPAVFYVYPVGDLWTAAWWPPTTTANPAPRWPDRVTGIRERCVEWLLEKVSSE